MAYNYIIIRKPSLNQNILYLREDESAGYLLVLLLYNFMGKSRKRQKNRRINGAKATQVYRFLKITVFFSPYGYT